MNFSCPVVFISPVYALSLDTLADFLFCRDLLLEQRIPSRIYLFIYMLEMLSKSIHSRTAAISCFSQETEATLGAPGYPFLYKKQFIGTVDLGLIENLLLGSLIENLLLSTEVKTDRYNFKNKILGNENHEKGLSLRLEFTKACLFWQMLLKSRFIFIVSTDWISLWGVRPWLLKFALLLGFCQNFLCPSLLLPTPPLSFPWI